MADLCLSRLLAFVILVDWVLIWVLLGSLLRAVVVSLCCFQNVGTGREADMGDDLFCLLCTHEERDLVKLHRE